MRSAGLTIAVWVLSGMLLTHCGAIKAAYWLTKNTIVLAYHVTKFAGKTVYTVGGFTFNVIVSG